jgi:tyrosine-protein kinase Etk/Wzc
VLETLGKSDPITTQVEVMKTRPIFEEVVRQCNLKDMYGDPLEPNVLAEQIDISVVRLSNIVSVSYRCGNPDSAAIVANVFVKVAEEQNQKLNREEVRSLRLFIENQLENQKVRLEQIEQAAVNYKKQEKTVDIDLQTRSQISAAAELKSEIIKLEGEKQGVLAQKVQIESLLNTPRAQADQFYASRLNTLEQINSRLTNIDAQKSSLSAQLADINHNLSSRPQEVVNLTRLLRDEKIADETYLYLRSKLQELEIREAAKTATIQLIEPAIPPKFPVSSQNKKLVLISFVLGAFLGCCIVFVIISVKNHPISTAAIKNALPYEILGTVPVVQKKNLLFFKDSPDSVSAESIRHIHTSLTFKQNNPAQHTNFMLTSATAGEGKSIVCANLVFALAETGRKVALVNLDLRRNVFGTMFTSKATKGIADYLSGNAELQDIRTSQQVYNFDLIDTAKPVSNPARVFLRGKVDEFFKELEISYDLCLFYGAPIQASSETLSLCHYMTGIILVADLMKSNMKGLAAMQELIEHKSLPVLGSVINRVFN